MYWKIEESRCLQNDFPILFILPTRPTKGNLAECLPDGSTISLKVTCKHTEPMVRGDHYFLQSIDIRIRFSSRHPYVTSPLLLFVSNGPRGASVLLSLPPQINRNA